ncbi:hypothetical protein CLHOM_11280 [Clostridium homopropionicum DSM 5847]|uniref:tRNA(Met) cytidine acetate ligase n=1 Tax=Clostridium homopropionicum DSM 5847 TaxID=1121318 RepID=A0A0L6ZC43_9CLOT|nr:nucleotidyltransferase [Clostridium homopropionicum]KOA20540.1 hypothetical protein CLHOM_11280 [Clostridium homopropionicum DSM 5847]SFG38107.1 Predicted nucleotidyltransferase [Clostridium homopropionicum]
MNISSIITEYNPMHNGHLLHINKTKEVTKCDGLICVMSGNFVQRGAPSIIDKWSKTEIALKNGVDLVIELPSTYSLSSAEFFSYGAVSLLNSLGIVKSICFGSEHGDIKLLYKIAEILYKESNEFKSSLRNYLSQGISFPKARNKALNEIIISNSEFDNIELDNILNNSNNILGIEYCKSLLKLNSSIIPHTIQRIGSSYNESNLIGLLPSATSIRNSLKTDNSIESIINAVPSNTLNKLQENITNKSLVFENSIFPYIKYKALTNNNNLFNLPDASEGLDNKIYKALHNSNTYDELLDKVKSKRYSYTRISRLLCQYFIGLENMTRNELIALRNSNAHYARVLGFNSLGRTILKEIKKVSSIPIITKVPKQLCKPLELDILTTKAYSIINSSISPEADFTISPIRIL